MRALTISDLMRIPGDVARLKPDFVLSILDPGEPAPELGLPPERHVIVRCYDTDDTSGPSREDVAQIHAFAAAVPDGARAIVHCHAGISRSPAAALVLLEAWGQPLELGPEPVTPNLRLLGLADPSGGLMRLGRALTRRAEAEVATSEDWYSPRRAATGEA